MVRDVGQAVPQAGIAVMKRPWMPLYVGDYLAKTSHLTTLQHGAYLLLILHYWANQGLPIDERELMAIARMTAKEWAKNRVAIASFFTPDWRHDRIEEEMFKAKMISTKRAYAGLKGAWTKHGGPVANAWQLPLQSQSPRS